MWLGYSLQQEFINVWEEIRNSITDLLSARDHYTQSLIKTLGAAKMERQIIQIRPVSTNSVSSRSHLENSILSLGIKGNGQISQINPCRHMAKTEEVLLSSLPPSGTQMKHHVSLQIFFVIIVVANIHTSCNIHCFLNFHYTISYSYELYSKISSWLMNPYLQQKDVETLTKYKTD